METINFLLQEKFFAFRDMAWDYLNERTEMFVHLEPYIRKRSPERCQRFLEDLSTRIATELLKRMRHSEEDQFDELFSELGEICADIDCLIVE